MRFEIEHHTSYLYSGPVFLEPHIVRLQPRSDPWQRLDDFDVEMSPAPAGSTSYIDAEGNAVVHAWFAGLTDHLDIRTRCVAETSHENPFDFVTSAEALALPPVYGEAERGSLTRFLAAPDPAAGALASECARAAKGNVMTFLGELCARIYKDVTVIHRPTGDPMSASETLESGRGSCRDLAVVFMEACRANGIAARFVSGYQQGDPGEQERHLHAWAEVYLSGAGWRGWDPTHGLAVADRHVAVAAGPDPRDAAPTAGTFRGTGATADMTTVLRIRTSE